MKNIVKNHLYILPTFIIVLIVHAWFISYGTWNFLAIEHLGTYFDAQARSLIDGRFDIDCDVLGMENYVLPDGKCYGTWAPTPAIFRIPLHFLFPDLINKWTKLSMFTACFISLLATYLVLLSARSLIYKNVAVQVKEKVVYSIFIFVAGLGTTLPYIASRGFVYHEAIIWGGALVLLSFYFAIRYLMDFQFKNMGFALLFCLLSLQARLITGNQVLLLCGGILLLLVVLLINERILIGNRLFSTIVKATGIPRIIPKVRHVLAIFLLMVLICSSILAVNYGKFGNVFSVSIEEYYLPLKLNPEILKKSRYQGKLFHLSNICFTLPVYFALDGITFTPYFPWVGGYYRDVRKESISAKIDYEEPVISIPAGMPAIFALALIGLYAVSRARSPFRLFRLPIFCAFMGSFALFFYFCIAHRYIHEFFPLLILCGAVGAIQMTRVFSVTLSRIFISILMLLSLFSVYVGLSEAFNYQKTVFGVPPDRVAELQCIGREMDNLITAIGQKCH